MLSDKARQDLFKFAIEKFPEECCGFILKDGSFVGLENIYLGNKEDCFEIKPTDYIKYANQIAFICHSHTDFDFTPSLSDMIHQIQSAVPWIIVGTNGSDCNLLIFGDMIIHKKWIGIDFVHGATDCYGLIKNWYYHHKKTLLPDFPRSNRWWENRGSSMYEQYFKDAGFYEKDSVKDIQDGDVVMFKIADSNVINHAAVYCGDGLFAHHLLSKWSKIERLDRYLNNPKIVKRIVGYDEKSDISRRNADNFRRAILI